jgi:HTH-type transcriptional regulator / antitoxin HigA
MNALLDVAGDDEDHPLAGPLEMAAELVSLYKKEHHAIEAANPQDALRFLMEARGLMQGRTLWWRAIGCPFKRGVRPN